MKLLILCSIIAIIGLLIGAGIIMFSHFQAKTSDISDNKTSIESRTKYVSGEGSYREVRVQRTPPGS